MRLAARHRAKQRRVLAVHAVSRGPTQRGLAGLLFLGRALTGRAPAMVPVPRSRRAIPIQFRRGRRAGSPARRRMSWAAPFGTQPSAARQQDRDLASDARPDRSRTVPGGHLREAVWHGRGHRGLSIFEVTTSGGDHTYRGPSTTRHGLAGRSDVIEDLQRRDFTINALAWAGPPARPGPGRTTCPHSSTPLGAEPTWDDGSCGQSGMPTERFQEDALRLLRGARFAATLGLDHRAWLTMAGDRLARGGGDRCAGCPAERIAGELRLACWPTPPPSRGAAGIWLNYIGALTVVGCRSSRPSTAWPCTPSTRATTCSTTGMRPRTPRATLPGGPRNAWSSRPWLHDIGKPATFGRRALPPPRRRRGAAGRVRSCDRLRVAAGRPSTTSSHLVRHHMFGCDPT